jgi:hypothetical protein
MSTTSVETHGRSKYIDLEPHEVKIKGYDLVSLKYDGIWCRALGQGPSIKLFSQENQLKGTITQLGKNYDFELIGEYMFGTEWAIHYGLEGKFYAFDVYRLGELDLTTLPYAKRLDYMAKIVDQLGEPFGKVYMRSIDQLDDLSERFVKPDGE